MMRQPTKNFRNGWSTDEKLNLLEALKTHGHTNMKLIRKAVPTKPYKSIEKYLNHFRRYAKVDLCSDKFDVMQRTINRKSFFGIKEMEPCNNSYLCRWIDIFTENSKTFNETLSVALKLIALLEQHPTDTEGVDLKQLYMHLSSTLMGNIPDSLNPKTVDILTCSLVDLATKSKKRRPQADVDFVQNINRIFTDGSSTVTDQVRDPSVPVEISEIQLSHMFNPLGLPLEALKRYSD